MADATWRRMNATVAILSLGILLLVLALLTARQTTPSVTHPSAVATYNALMNSVTVVALTFGYVFIRRGQTVAHRRAMFGALFASLAFLAGYIWHHATVGSVRYAGGGAMRVLYFSLLIPHVVLAAVEVPLVLLTVLHALSGRFERHRTMARVALPVWLFVSASGVAVYWLLYWT